MRSYVVKGCDQNAKQIKPSLHPYGVYQRQITHAEVNILLQTQHQVKNVVQTKRPKGSDVAGITSD